MSRVLRKLAAAVGTVAVAGAISVAAAQVNLTFENTAVGDGMWIGNVGGDVTGRLMTTMFVADRSQPVWEVDFYCIVVADDPSRSFVARLTGTLDTTTGAVVMIGKITEGYQVGARVREVGQLQDAEASTFTGTIRVLNQTDPYADALSLAPGGGR